MIVTDLLKKRLQRSSQHFQVALQVMTFKPHHLKRIMETGFAMYRGGEKANNPLFLHLEPTGVCNLKCTMCPRTESITRNLQHMDLATFKKICDQIDPIYIAFVGFGEPLANPETLDMVRYSVGKGIISRISSNATLLTEKRSRDILDSGLHQIWFSIDSPTPENFEKIRVGAKFGKTMEGIREFMRLRAELKSKILVTINFTITRENVHEIADMVRYCKNELNIMPTFARGYGYDITAQQNRALQAAPEVIAALDQGLAAARDAGWEPVELNLKTILFDLKDPIDGKGPCYFPYYTTAVSWDGKVTPCCLFYDYQMNLGNVKRDPFSQVWNGKAYQNFRIKLKKKRCDINICNTCPLNDISLHNIMHTISKVPLAGLLSKEKYAFIDRGEK